MQSNKSIPTIKRTRKKMKKRNNTKNKMCNRFCLFVVCLSLFAFMFIVGDCVARVYLTTTSPSTSHSNLVVPNDAIEHLEMLNVIVHVATPSSAGSGILIGRSVLNDKDMYEYLVLTNAHIVANRRTKEYSGVDGLRGMLKFEIKDPGCKITTFSRQATDAMAYDAQIIAESSQIDLALIRFDTKNLIDDIAIFASRETLENISVFDVVYAVGCQLNHRPIPTDGLISGLYYKEKFIGFSYTADIAPGSSGGGLFKKYDGHYYLIGVPSMVEGYGFQFVPHYAYAISLKVVYQFLADNDLCNIAGCPYEVAEVATGENITIKTKVPKKYLTPSKIMKYHDTCG